MSDAIIVAVIALAGQIIIAAISNSGIVAKLDKQSEVSDTKIHGEIDVIKNEVSTLRQEVQKHNSLIDRTYKLEGRVELAEQRLKSLESK